MGEDNTEKVTVPNNGNFEGKFQGINRGEATHDAIGIYHGLRD